MTMLDSSHAVSAVISLKTHYKPLPCACRSVPSMTAVPRRSCFSDYHCLTNSYFPSKKSTKIHPQKMPRKFSNQSV